MLSILNHDANDLWTGCIAFPSTIYWFLKRFRRCCNSSPWLSLKKHLRILTFFATNCVMTQKIQSFDASIKSRDLNWLQVLRRTRLVSQRSQLHKNIQSLNNSETRIRRNKIPRGSNCTWNDLALDVLLFIVNLCAEIFSKTIERQHFTMHINGFDFHTILLGVNKLFNKNVNHKYCQNVLSIISVCLNLRPNQER